LEEDSAFEYVLEHGTMNQMIQPVDYKLAYFGHEVLKKRAKEVEKIDQDVIDLIDAMFQVMHRERGIGLAAPQIALSKRIIVVDLGVYKGPALALINPVIEQHSDNLVPYEEGCLSVPGIMKEIIRPDLALVKGVTPEGKEVRIEANGLLSRVLQHEIDHLNGILFKSLATEILTPEQLEEMRNQNEDDIDEEAGE
jgi:peptide deformylase